VAVARSSSGGVAIRYALPVLWMTSLGRSGLYGASGGTIPARSLTSTNALLVID